MNRVKKICVQAAILTAGAVLAMVALVPAAGANPVRINFSGVFGGSGSPFSGYADLTLAPDPHASSTFPAPNRPHVNWDWHTQGPPPGTESIAAGTQRVDPANAMAITGASGMFNGHAIVGVMPVASTQSEPAANEYIPSSVTKLRATNAPPDGPPLVTYDNLFFVGNSPLTCLWRYPDGTFDWKYPFSGGFLDIYGVLLQLDNGEYVDLWSNGVMPQIGLNFGAILFAPAEENYNVLDYQFNGAMASIPEPGFLWMFGAGLLGLFGWRRVRERGANAAA